MANIYCLGSCPLSQYCVNKAITLVLASYHISQQSHLFCHQYQHHIINDHIHHYRLGRGVYPEELCVHFPRMDLPVLPAQGTVHKKSSNMLRTRQNSPKSVLLVFCCCQNRSRHQFIQKLTQIHLIFKKSFSMMLRFRYSHTPTKSDKSSIQSWFSIIKALHISLGQLKFIQFL